MYQKQDLTTQEYGELKLASENLVNYLPELQNYYNEATGVIDLEREAIEKLIEQGYIELFGVPDGYIYDSASKTYKEINGSRI